MPIVLFKLLSVAKDPESIEYIAIEAEKRDRMILEHTALLEELKKGILSVDA